MMRQLTGFETSALLAVGRLTIAGSRYNTPGDVAAEAGRVGNAMVIAVNQALQRLEGRGFVTYNSEANEGGTNWTKAGKHGWELTTTGADECQTIARMKGGK